jgi:hypothetical protein
MTVIQTQRPLEPSVSANMRVKQGCKMRSVRL